MSKKKFSSIDQETKNQFQASSKKIQEIIFENKKSKGFNIKNIPLEFCFTHGELAEAFEAWRKKKNNLGEELGDVAIYVFGLASILKIDLGEEILKKIEKNKKRKIIFGKIKTIKGNYMYSSLVEKQLPEEVEIKAKVSFNGLKEIKRKILALGAKMIEKEEEEDIYYTSSHNDFIKSKECLRIREKGGELEITYKGPTTEKMKSVKQFWKSEININVPIHQKKDTEEMLRNLGFKEIIRVFKKRELFLFGEQKIFIDFVKKAGFFVEIEKKVSNKKERKNALRENFKTLLNLGIKESDVVNMPYRDLVIEATKKK